MAPSRLLNPTLDQARIEAEIEADPEAGRSEWLGQFREDITQFLDDEMIDRAIVPGRTELPRAMRLTYKGFVDPSGGRHDAMTLGIAHAGGTKIILDRVLFERPPFQPEAVVERFAVQLRAYGLTKVTGDRYAGDWVTAAFAKHQIRYGASEHDKSSIYIESLPLFSQGRVELLDVPRLHTELRLLERRPRSGGKGDVVDHPPRASDDLANACCGALVLAAATGLCSYTHGILHKISGPEDRMAWPLRRFY